jgi:TrpR-related protein YerC/YecD
MNKQAWDNRNTAALIVALLSLKTAGQAKRFLRDLMTEAELVEFGNRWKAAQMLAQRERYVDIAAQTGLSSRTIARISKWLNSGMGGYRSLIKSATVHHHKVLPSPGVV